MLDYLFFSPDHLAIPALESPDTAARADIDVVQGLRGEVFRTPDVVDVVGVAAVDDDVASVEFCGKILQRSVDHRGGNHQPDGSRPLELLHQIIE
jgi:hypothetical protein